ncbi:MAG: hypothetical protein U5K00_12140 [Melioribacteraceae bacterium]|nr:hypothetical protein [Melioribacteraceae bacterium]
MSLVPILYTSLILFTILMVVVLTFSYIAYKVRNRSNGKSQKREETYDYLTRPRHIGSQQQVQRSKIRVVPTIKNPELRKPVPPTVSARRTKIINSNELDKSASTTGTKYSEERRYTTANENIGMSRTTAGSYNKRIEVLNRVIPKEEPKESFNVGDSGSITLAKHYNNFRALQYYTDDDEDYYYKPNRYFD